jgi:site-specific DNA recombinase
MTTLRFAPIIRVSTEQQTDARNESLRVQRTQINHYVTALHGLIPEECEQKYSGQEHATPEFERAMLDQLLVDATRNIFDAVIVTDIDRWSRDNLKSKTALKIFRENHIRFFLGMMEMNLFNPIHSGIVGQQVENAEMQALLMAQKSINSRIARCQRGVPAVGYLPYGRTYDRKTDQWGIDATKQRLMEQVAERYLSGEGFTSIARTIQMNPSHLHRILTQRSGTEWTIRLRNKRLNIDETIPMQVPRLLPQQTIDAIHERTRINITYERGHRKHKYLLPGMIFCSKCGRVMAGYTNSYGKSYYRHARSLSKCFHNHVTAQELENSLLVLLVRTFGDPERIARALQLAVPDMAKRQALEDEQQQYEKELKRIVVEKDRIVEGYSKELYTEAEAKKNMDKLREQENSINVRLVTIEAQLADIPDPEQIKKSSQWAGKIVTAATRNNPSVIFKRSFEWKRKLVERAFSGVNPTGQRLGVYIAREQDHFTFEIRGAFESTVMALPLTDELLIEAFNIDSQYQNVDEKLREVKSNIAGIQHRDACILRLCQYQREFRAAQYD